MGCQSGGQPDSNSSLVDILYFDLWFSHKLNTLFRALTHQRFSSIEMAFKTHVKSLSIFVAWLRSGKGHSHEKAWNNDLKFETKWK